MAALEHGEALQHVLESPHAVTFTPEGHAAIRAMLADAYARIRGEAEMLAEVAEPNDGSTPEGSPRERADAYRLAVARFEARTFENLAAVLVSMLTLGGRVTREDARNLYVTAPHLTYGVNQDRDGSWSVNS